MMDWLSPAEAADAIVRGRGRGVKIAILDSGVEAAHPALGGLELADDVAIVEEGQRLKVAPGGVDRFGHGTAIASILRRVAPEAELGSFRVFGESLSTRTATIAEGARLAMERGYHILNCSFGCAIPDHVLHHKRWVDEAYLKGIHIVAACNNHDFTRPEWPGYFSSVITVNMARTGDESHLFHKRGSLVEFAAHGVDVEVAWCDGLTKKVTGSSFAAPRVAGMLACMLSVKPGLRPLQVKTLFHRVAHPWTQELRAPNE